jgi:tetratricopeptide (TPR) repeat protein
VSVFYVCSAKETHKVVRISFGGMVWVLLALLAWRCSPEQNNLTSTAFHNTAAHFNGYFYAREEARGVQQTILKSLDDDPNQVLRLFPKLDTTLARSYKKQTDEIIKMASISIQRHPNSRWVDDNYVMVGLARLYACDFQNAIVTFKYVNQKSKDPNVRHQALVYLIRTFNEQGEFERAEEAADYLSKEKLSRTNAKNLYLERAYLYQVQGNYDKMVRNLSMADTLLTREDRKGRIYFIIGQVFQKLNLGSEAYNYYRKCLATTPEYEIDFYARLNMAQVARFDNPDAVRTIRHQFNRMLKDEKNKEFKDKIYYEMAQFEWKQKNLRPAVANYQLAAHAGTNKRIQGQAFLMLGEIHFDTLRKYSLAKAYYDSALASLPPEFENFTAIKKRQEILTEYVKYSETITLQDSLLTLAKMDTAVLHKKIDSLQTARAKADEAKKAKRKQQEAEDRGSRNTGLYEAQTATTADWYFGNPTAVALGQSEFQRIWGSIALTDNWRRSTKSAVIADEDPTNAIPDIERPANNLPPPKVVGKTPPAEKKNSLFDELYAMLPKTDNEVEKALALIEEAYFKLGDLNYFKLNEKGEARILYEKLLNRFPKSKLKPEVLYKLYLIVKEINPAEAEPFKSALLAEFPTSTYARILLNPDYLKETGLIAEKQKVIYKEAFAEYNAGHLVDANHKLDTALALGESGFVPQLELLKVMITGKTEDITRYQFELGEFAKKFPDSPLQVYANELLTASKTFQEKAERAKGIRFVRNPEARHQYIIVHKRNDKLSTPLVDELENLNETAFKKLKILTSNLAFNDELTLTLAMEFADLATARQYQQVVESTILNKPQFAYFKFDTFVITPENFSTFFRTKALDEYLAFYDRNY